MKMQSPFKKLLPTFLIINTLVLSSLPASANYSTKSTAKCRAAITEAKKTISKGRKIKINIKIFNVAEHYSDYPKQYPVGYTFIFSGAATEQVMNSVKFLSIISKRIITKCESVGLIDFSQDGTDWVQRYGIINGELKAFECVDPPQNNISWGIHVCL